MTDVISELKDSFPECVDENTKPLFRALMQIHAKTECGKQQILRNAVIPEIRIIKSEINRMTRGYSLKADSPQFCCGELRQSVICIEAAVQIPYSIPPFSRQMG